jgi:acetylornithine deacetylase/succinyl-diaminopimelate desuccinylase-like protein
VAAGAEGATLRAEPRVDRWIFSTDGVGYPVATGSLPVPADKGWVDAGAVVHPAMVGIGAGVEQNTHKVGEYVDLRELQHAIAVLTAFPQRYVAARRA